MLFLKNINSHSLELWTRKVRRVVMADSKISEPTYPDLPNPLVVILDNRGCIEQINDPALALLEYDKQELLGENWFSRCVPVDWRVASENIFRQILDKGIQESAFSVLPVQSKSGKQYNLTWYSELTFSNDRTTGTILTGVHTKETSTTESNTLLQVAARGQAVLDNAAEAIINIDANGIITDVNKATEIVFGYEASELIDHNIRCLMSEPHRGQHDHYIKRYLKTGEKRIIGTGREVTGRKKDGSAVILELHIAEINVHGKRSFTGVIRDVSERNSTRQQIKTNAEELHQTRERLAHMDRLHIASEMATGIAHELNQPLAAIAMYAQACRRLLESGKSDTEILLDTLSRIDNQAQRAGAVIRNLRALVSKQTPEHQLEDINALIKNTIELALTGIDTQQITIDCRLSSTVPKIDLIYVQIQQVLLNLINNARDALSDSPILDKRIVVSSSSDTTHVKVSVADNGDGITGKHAADIFTPFFSTKDADKGMGMGLAISRSIISDHQGVLELNTQYKSGAEFIFTLPIKPSREGKHAEQ